MRSFTAALLLSLLALPSRQAQYTLEKFGSCNQCYCVREDGLPCPIPAPVTNFSDLIPIWSELQHLNPIEVVCNPFDPNAICVPVPPVQPGGACILQLEETDLPCPDGWRYSLFTYPGTVDEARAQGLLVTHAGACGACSGLADLIVYIEMGPMLNEEIARCGAIGGESPVRGLDCVRNLQFTDSCANLWYKSTMQAFIACQQICMEYLTLQLNPNGAPPRCEVAECYKCRAATTGASFVELAGRIPSNSGLLSNVVYPCASLFFLEHINPCDYTDPPTLPPGSTLIPTESMTSLSPAAGTGTTPPTAPTVLSVPVTLAPSPAPAEEPPAPPDSGVRHLASSCCWSVAMLAAISVLV